MKIKLLAGAALAGVLAAGSAAAAPADSGWYGAIDLGGHIQAPAVTTAQFGELGDSPANLRVNDAANFAGFARVGYKISPRFRPSIGPTRCPLSTNGTSPAARSGPSPTSATLRPTSPARLPPAAPTPG